MHKCVKAFDCGSCHMGKVELLLTTLYTAAKKFKVLKTQVEYKYLKTDLTYLNKQRSNVMRAGNQRSSCSLFFQIIQ